METKRKNKFRHYTRASKLLHLSPREFDAVIFDMDGVVTKTQKIHATAWKKVFDQFLQAQYGPSFRPFTIEGDYRRYVDGRSRYDGVEGFLASREISLPWGDQTDGPSLTTVCGLANLKNGMFLQAIDDVGVEPYETTIALIRGLRSKGIKTGIVTASQNGESILQAANVLHLFDVKIDGADAIDQDLKGKPAPDTFLAAAKLLKVLPNRAAVVEDAPAGVEAGKKGGFKLVIGVNRGEDGALLHERGADVVVDDLLEVGVNGQTIEELPSLVCADLAGSLHDWNLVFDNYDPALEGRREALCALGNGYFVTRAASPDSTADTVHYPGTYGAGLYNRLTTDLGDTVMEHEDLVNLPNWLPLTFRIENGPWFNIDSAEILKYKQTLNILEGILYREIEFRDDQGRETRILERRFVHMRHYHLAGLEMTIIALNWSGNLKVRSAIDGRVLNNGVEAHKLLNNKHLQWISSEAADDVMLLKMRTTQSCVRVATAVRTAVQVPANTSDKLQRFSITQPEYVAQNIHIPIKQGEEIVVQKTAAIYTSRDIATSEPGLSARNALGEFDRFWKLVDEHIESWRHLWRRFDLDLETTPTFSKNAVSLALHLHSFHILQTASPNSAELDVGLPARGWTGEAYQGHVFWDDIFIFPFLNLRMPEIAKGLLRYRYRRLAEARKLAKARGARGACFPWQSASDGREETPPYMWSPYKNSWNPEHTNLQIHVNAAIVYNIWQYNQATADSDFMNAYGSEVMLEIARFFGSIAQYNSERDCFEIHGVCGPDEYHAADPETGRLGINNNAYTNIMVAWTLSRALELINNLPDDQYNEICEQLDLYTPEIEQWENISRKMFVPIQDNGIISQFEDFEKLEEFPWKTDHCIDQEKLKEILKDNGGQLPHYKVAKQADVLMLFYLFSAEELEELFNRLGHRFTTAMIQKNIEYYTPRTAHNSTLSRVAQAWVLSRLDRSNSWLVMSAMPSQGEDEPGLEEQQVGTKSSAKTTDTVTSVPATELLPKQKDRVKRDLVEFEDNHHTPRSWDIFIEALGSDLFDIQGGTTAEGIHIGAMAGTIDIVQRCYTGIVIRNEVLWIKPKLPEGLIRLSFNLHYRKVPLHFDITRERSKITALQSLEAPIKIGFKGRVYHLNPGKTIELRHQAEAA